jgi:hypothetical protein
MLRKRPTWCSGRGASDAAPNRKGNNLPQLKKQIAVVTSGIGLATAKWFVGRVAGREELRDEVSTIAPRKGDERVTNGTLCIHAHCR